MKNKKWISVKDKYPKRGIDVLATDGTACVVTCYKGDHLWDFFGLTIWHSDEISHWQKLPKKP